MYGKQFLAAAATVGIGLVAGAGTAQAGVTGPAFYVDHVLYRTVLTTTDFEGTGAPEHTYDTIYSFGDHQRSVATSAPGYTDYNGGRWAVHAVSLPHGYAAALASGDLDDDGVLDSTAEVMAAIADGDLVPGPVVRRFVCTVNPVPPPQA